ncbi:MAG: response regulator transcription factor [Chryseotalea sp.]|jgi:DNA-binding response OmpR family regulator
MNATLNLLIADDEPSLPVLLKEFFRKEFNSTHVPDGDSCLHHVTHVSVPDVIILDLNMPGLDGLQTVKRIRENPEWNNIAIVMLSATENSTARIECLKAGADDFITKPFNPEEIRVRIRAILRRILEVNHPWLKKSAA